MQVIKILLKDNLDWDWMSKVNQKEEEEKVQRKKEELRKKKREKEWKSKVQRTILIVFKRKTCLTDCVRLFCFRNQTIFLLKLPKKKKKEENALCEFYLFVQPTMQIWRERERESKQFILEFRALGFIFFKIWIRDLVQLLAQHHRSLWTKWTWVVFSSIFFTKTTKIKQKQVYDWE